MIRSVKHICLYAAALLTAAGCSQPEGDAAGEGVVRLSAEVAVAMDAATRAGRVGLDELGCTGLPAASDMMLRVVSADGKHPYDQTFKGPQQLTLFATTYDVSMYAAGAEPQYDDDGVLVCDEGENKPFFAGSQSVTVPKGGETSVQLTAGVANTVVCVKFSENFMGYFGNGAEFTIATDAGNSFGAGYDAGAGEAGVHYYFVQPRRFVISGWALKQTPASGMSPVKVEFADTVNESPAAGTMYTYTFDVSTVGSSDGGVQITLNGDPVETEEVDTELNPGARP